MERGLLRGRTKHKGRWGPPYLLNEIHALEPAVRSGAALCPREALCCLNKNIFKSIFEETG